MFVVHRSAHNPILSPRHEHPWEALASFNPSAVKTSKGTQLFYRALANPDALVSPHAGMSTIGSAFSVDGTHFHSRQQVIVPTEEWEKYGCEDPRATFFEGKWYVFYTALGGFPFGPSNIKVAVASGDTPQTLHEKHLITPFNAKAATLFPERIDGDIVLLLTAHTDWTAEYPRPIIGIARAKHMHEFYDETYWNEWHAHMDLHELPQLRRSDDDHVEVGPAPIKTEKGWLLVYSYIQHYYDEKNRIFGVEAALLDLSDPRKILSRTFPFLVPDEIYELYGLVPKIIFPSGLLETDKGMLEIYYGGADTTSCRASVRTSDLLDTLDADAKPTFTRALENPILAPITKNTFENTRVFNPAAIDIDGTVYIIYRAMDDKNTSYFGLATSKDGITIDERLKKPIYSPRAPFEMKMGKEDGNSGVEDPRVVLINERIYLTYTAYDGVRSPKGAVSSISVSDFLAKKFTKWTEPTLLTPDEFDDKDLSLLPEKVNDNFLLYHRISGRVCVDLLPEIESSQRVSRCIEIIGPRRGMWDSAKVGIASPPIKTGNNWLMLYHGVSDRGNYRVGALLLDHTGTNVLSRSANPIFEATTPYEMSGTQGIVFPCGAIVRDDTIYMYYGGADVVTGVATASLPKLVASLT